MTESDHTTDLARRNAPGDLASSKQESNSLTRIDNRIADPATSIQEAMILTRIRGEIIKQDEFRLDRADVRRVRGRQFWGKLLFSVGAVGTGAALIATGMPLEGFVILGVGFHWLAPDFVKSVYGQILGGKDKGDAE
jgi:hypothetical protein